jgi:hypothetical protein
MTLEDQVEGMRLRALSLQAAARELKHDKRLGVYARAHMAEVEALAQTIVVQFKYIELAVGEGR